MKTLLLLSGAAWLSACGSSSGGTLDAGMQTLPVPATTNQAPQQPADSVPPINSQQPAINSQQPPVNSQQPPIDSQQPPLGVQSPAGVITCNQVATAVSNAGCVVSSAQMTACIAGTTANAPCSAQWQTLFVCMLRGVVCNSDGSVNLDASCPNENDALDTCLGNMPANCTAASLCNGCPNDCATCRCGTALVAGLDCTQTCANN